MEEGSTRVCGLPVALGDVEVLGVDDAPGELLGHFRGLHVIDYSQFAGTYATDLADPTCPPGRHSGPLEHPHRQPAPRGCPGSAVLRCGARG